LIHSLLLNRSLSSGYYVINIIFCEWLLLTPVDIGLSTFAK